MQKQTKIVPNDKFQLFNDYWSPKVVGELNESEVKLVKLKGEFNWHHHKNEDELFIVVKGHLAIQFRDETLEANPGEMILIPKMVEHCPTTEEECWIILIDPKGTLNTGNVRSDKTADDLEKI